MAPVRLGIIGCGAIAQVHHLPNLAGLQEEFQVDLACDLSPTLAQTVARKFHVPHHTSDYHQLLDSDVEAVLLCHSDPKTEVALAAFAAGKHVFIEKPVCFSLREADALIAAAQKAGKVAQAGYVKVYDPAFERAQREADAMDEIHFVQINHLHPDNTLHLRQFHLERFDDIPESALSAAQTARNAALHEALGPVSAEMENAFYTLSGSLIHDLYGLRHIMGQPTRVVNTEIWQDGRCINTLLEYPSGARCTASWVDLRDLWDFKETLEIYGPGKQVIVSYPTGFARGILSTVTLQGIDAEGNTFRQEPAIDWENPFTRELRHFHACITQATPCRTPIEAARHDVALVIDIARAYLERH
jgi:predicted dehydrogenase